MSVLYKIFNPADGLYTNVETLDECLKITAERAYNLYMQYTHQQPYSIVEITEEGYEVWNDNTIDEEQIKTHIVNQIKK
jgi:hypothetical protein